MLDLFLRFVMVVLLALGLVVAVYQLGLAFAWWPLPVLS